MKPGRIALSKELHGYLPFEEEGLFTVNDDIGHARIRHSIAAGFSDKSLHQQKSILKQYFDLLMNKLRENESSDRVDMVHWMGLLSSDVIGDLMFGKSMGHLARGIRDPLQIIRVLVCLDVTDFNIQSHQSMSDIPGFRRGRRCQSSHSYHAAPNQGSSTQSTTDVLQCDGWGVSPYGQQNHGR